MLTGETSWEAGNAKGTTGSRAAGEACGALTVESVQRAGPFAVGRGWNGQTEAGGCHPALACLLPKRRSVPQSATFG